MLFIFLNLLILFAFIFLVYLLFQGAIYVPSSDRAIKTMLLLSKVKKGDKVADLGSGDGRVAIAFAQKGAIVDGYEINPYLVWLSRNKVKKNNLQNRIKIYWKSYWGINLSKYKVIIVFGIDHIMNRLKKKLMGELQSKSKILLNLFPFPGLKADKTQNGIYLYKITRRFVVK